ncbi:MAG: ATP-grasp domain-containing protein [Candidatus Methanoglobus sp.]
MKLHEYQAKRIFAEYGIRIPRGAVAESPEEVRRAAESRRPRITPLWKGNRRDPR